jgi:hypothetical protein
MDTDGGHWRYDTQTHSINGPPQCGVYTLGQLSRLYVIIRLEETNKKWNYCKIQTVQCPPSVSMSQYTSIPFELHLFKCVVLLCIVIIDIVFWLIYMCDFNFIIYVFSYDTRNIWVLLPRTMTIKIIFEIIKSPYWFDIRHCISLSVSYNKVFTLFCVLGGVLQTILVMYIYIYIYCP